MKFNYQARTKDGEIQSGVVEAPSKDAAFNLLRKHDLHLTGLEEAGEGPVYSKEIKIFQRVSRKEVVLFSRHLAIMFKSQISLVETLRTLASQTKNSYFREKIIAIVEDVEGGTPLSQAMRGHPKVFSPFYVAMIKSGEVSGNLSGILEYLANHLEREYNFISRVRSAAIYPAMIVLVSVGIMFMMSFFVLPNMMKMLEGTTQQLPLITRVVMRFSALIKNWGWLALILLTGAGFLLAQYYRTANGRKIIDRLILKIPLVGKFLKTVYLSQFASNLSVLISGALPIARAMEITAEIISNTAFKDIILQGREGVRRGVPISSILEKHQDIFPPIFCQMTLVGEKTGTLDKTLMNIVGFYEKEVDRDLNTLLSVLEPLMIIILGLMVGGLLAAVLLPLYKAMSI